jgi:hypothetical protein
MSTRAEKPILFCGEMIRALLNTQPGVWPAKAIDPTKPFKSQTRRIIALQEHACLTGDCGHAKQSECEAVLRKYSPFKVGQLRWVRETWKPHCEGEISEKCPLGTCVKYRADGALLKPTDWTHEQGTWCEAHEEDPQWHPSIFMPRWASRLLVEVKAVRCERVQDIPGNDALAEGADLSGELFPHANRLYKAQVAYRRVWDSLNKKRGYSWESNCWVFAVSFMRVK